MGTNFHSAWDTDTLFKPTSMNPALASLDQAITYLKNVMVSCAGIITYNKATGVLTWSGTITILFIDQNGLAKANTIAAGNITIVDNQFVYVTLSETNNAVLTASVATVTTGSASNFKDALLLVLGYRDTTSDEFYSDILDNVKEAVVTLTSSANVTIDWSKGKRQQIILGHDVAFTHSGGIDGETYFLYIRQDPASARTPTWVNNRYGTEVTSIVISATLSSENIAEFIYRTGIGYCAVRSVSTYVAPP
jgi:hypothetical protein